MNNPFEIIEARLSNIESLLLNLKHSFLEQKPESVSESLLTVKQTAELLSLSVPTIYTLISKGEIPVMKRSKRCYFSKSEILEYLKAGRKSTNSEVKVKAGKQPKTGNR